MTTTLNGTTLLSVADLDAQPEGTVMEYGRPTSRGLFTKVVNGQWRSEGGQLFAPGSFHTFGPPPVVVRSPETTDEIIEEMAEEITPETHLTVAQLEAFPEGTVVADCAGGAHANEFVKRDGRWWNEDRDTLHNELLDIARHGEGGVRWRRWASVCGEAHTERITELENLVEQLRRDRDHARQQTITIEERVHQLNTRLNEWADNESLDSDYDELMEGFSDIEVHGRTAEYEVEVLVSCRHVATVRAANADAAYELVIEGTGFRDGDSRRLYDEDVLITDVSAGDIEEV